MQILRQVKFDWQNGEFIFQPNLIIGFVGVPSNVRWDGNFDSFRFWVTFFDKVFLDRHRENGKHKLVNGDSKTPTRLFDCFETELGGKSDPFDAWEVSISIVEWITVNTAHERLLYYFRQI